MQSVVMEDAYTTPWIDTSSLNDVPFKNYVVQQSSMLKLLPCRSDETWSCADRLAKTGAETRPQACPSIDDRSHDQNECIPRGPLQGGIGMTMAPTDSLHAGSSSSEEDNICNENELSPSRLLLEKAFVEVENRNPVDPVPFGSSVSMENVVADQNVLTPSRPLSERPDELDQFLCDPKTRRPLSSGIPSSFNNTTRELQSTLNELSENQIGGQNPALSAGFQGDSAQKHDKLSLIEQQSDRDVFKDGEVALTDSLPMQSLCRNSALPFSRKTDYWESVESRQVFRELPQQPHFRPLLEYQEEYREGMAIGLMVTFDTLVRNVSQLRIDDPQQRFEQLLKAFGPLEQNGFDVHPLRARVESLLNLHAMSNQSKCKKHSLGEKLQELDDEMEQSSLLKSSVEKLISQMEERTSVLKGKRTSLIHEMEKVSSEIPKIKADIEEAEKAGASAESQFFAALSAPWRRSLDAV